MTLLFILNSFLLAQTTIPFTLTSQLAPKKINSIIQSFPHGFPTPDLSRSISQNNENLLSSYQEIGITSFYNKKVAMPPLLVNPTFISHLSDFLQDTIMRQETFKRPVVYLEKQTVKIQPSSSSQNPSFDAFSDTTHSVSISKWSNDEFNFKVRSGQPALLCLQQVWLPGWKAWIDGKAASVEMANKAFIAIRLKEGNHIVKLKYRPRWIHESLIFSICFAIVLIGCFIAFKPWRIY